CALPISIVNQVLAFIPNLLVAVLILAAFSWLASLARNLVTAALQPTMANAKTIGVLAYGATFGFGVIAAATQIGVATTLIDIMFVGIVGALALAFGLAFGLGGREEAARMWGNMRGAVGNVVTEGAAATSDKSGNGRPVEQRPQRGFAMLGSVRPLAIVSLVARLGATACSSGGNAPGTGASGSTINVMSLWGGSEQDSFQKVLDAFKTKTGVTAKYESIRTD